MESKIDLSIQDKDRDDVMERLLELGGDKKYLTFDDLNRELPDNVVSPDDIEDVLQKLEGSNIQVADSDERLLEQAAAVVVDDEETEEDVELDLSAGRDAFLAQRGHWFAAWMSERLDRLDGFGVNVKNNTRAGIAASGRDLGAAETVRGAIWHRFRTLFERYDHLLTPTMAVSPFPVEQNYPETVAGKTMQTYVDWLAPTFVLSLTGLPVASVPCGLDRERMPVGLQIVGRPEGEEEVLALAGRLPGVNTIGSPSSCISPPARRLAARGFSVPSPVSGSASTGLRRAADSIRGTPRCDSRNRSAPANPLVPGSPDPPAG